MQVRQSIVVLVALMVTGISCGPVTQPEGAETQLKTNIAVLSSGESLDDFMGSEKQGLTVIDPSKMMDNASLRVVEPGDIIEDPNDPFITSRSGKPRPNFVSSDNEWAESTISKQPLHRVKRCGGGGDGDGDANRSRRARRARRNRARRARRARARRARADASTTTTVRKVIRDGQVVSETVVPQSGVVQHQPVVQAVMPQQQPILVHHQPQVVAAQPQVVTAQQPQVVAARPQVAAAAPSISVQGSVKVN